MLLKLLRPFLRESLKVHAGVFVVAELGFVLCTVLKLADGVFFIYLLPLLTLILPLRIGGNLSWLLSQPVSKNQLMLGTAVFAACNLALLIANLFLISCVHSLVGGRPRTLLWIATEIFRNYGKVRLERLELGPPELSVFLALLCLSIAILCFPHRLALNVQGVPQPQRRPTLRQQLIVLGVILGFIIGIPVAIATRLLSEFSIFAIITLLAPMALMASSMTSVGFAAPYRRLWIRGTLAFCLLCVALPFTMAVWGMAGGNPPAKRYDSVDYLGLFAGSWNQRSVLEAFLKSDLPPPQARRAAEAYFATSNSKFFGGDPRNWLVQKPEGLQFRDVIDGKSDYTSMHEVGKIFDPASLSAGDLDFYLARAKKLCGQDPTCYSAYQKHLGAGFWLRTPLSDAKVIELLQSDHNEAVDVGLFHVRYNPKKEFHDALLAAFRKGIPNRSVDEAIFTLSLISNAPYSLRGLASLEAGKHASLAFTLHDCKDFEKYRQDERPEAQKIFGQCLRRKAFASKWKTAQNTDNTGRRPAD